MSPRKGQSHQLAYTSRTHRHQPDVTDFGVIELKELGIESAESQVLRILEAINQFPKGVIVEDLRFRELAGQTAAE